jgi:integrase/recombinase XerD
LLAVTGRRVAEARALPLTDITAEGLRLREATFHKSRLLPRPGTTQAALERSRGARCRSAGADPHLVVTRRGRKLAHTVVSEPLHQVLMAAGVPREPGRRRPRRMDLRHPFAVRALARCPETRDASGRHRLALTPDRGHACVSSTDWSLESTPPLMTALAGPCETFMSGGGSCHSWPRL